MNEELSVRTLIAKSNEFLIRKGVVGNTRLDAELLLGSVLNVDRLKLILRATEVLDATTTDQYRQLILRRAKKEPVAYILGYKYFLGLRLKVDRRALIPRPETEELAAWALEAHPTSSQLEKRKATEVFDPKSEYNFEVDPEVETGPEPITAQFLEKTSVVLPPPLDQELIEIPKQAIRAPAKSIAPADLSPALRVLDLCTGTGCLGLALAKARPHWDVYFSDLDTAALALCRENVIAQAMPSIELQTDNRFLQSDLLKNAPSEWREFFNIIVCNPPYVWEDERNTLAPDVLEHEPHIALFRNNVTEFIHELIDECWTALKPSGELYIEAEPRSLTELRSQWEKSNPPAWSKVEFKKDSFGKLRFLALVRNR